MTDCPENLSPGDSATESAHRALRRLLRRGGPGTIRKVERALGLSRDAIGQWRRRGKLELAALVDVLSELDHPPSKFFSRLFPSPPSPANENEELLFSIRYARSHCHDQPLAALQALERTLERQAGAIDTWDFCLAVGSTLAIFELGRLAETWLRRAASLAPSNFARAQALVRTSPILTLERVQPNDGIEIARTQVQHFSGDSESIALATYFDALGHYKLKRYPEALRLLEATLAQPEVSRRVAASAHQIRAMCFHEIGDLKASLQDLDLAATFSNDSYTTGHILWAIARVRKDPSLFDQTIIIFRQHVYHALRVGIERVELYGDDQTFDLLEEFTKPFLPFSTALQEMKAAADSGTRSAHFPRAQAEAAWNRFRSSLAAPFIRMVAA